MIIATKIFKNGASRTRNSRRFGNKWLANTTSRESSNYQILFVCWRVMQWRRYLPQRPTRRSFNDAICPPTTITYQYKRTGIPTNTRKRTMCFGELSFMLPLQQCNSGYSLTQYTSLSLRVIHTYACMDTFVHKAKTSFAKFNDHSA
ncbi:unnamed protein product [Ceratitis capitata]|uniref:(Mediterranean fruit fly) hypothetical protein n=1 Tax=Ceratitis capitata TaxID=7213 RepID=A0A811VAI3_CERCA|nr:unnamed protein product [Ceratitis capitata]